MVKNNVVGTYSMMEKSDKYRLTTASDTTTAEPESFLVSRVKHINLEILYLPTNYLPFFLQYLAIGSFLPCVEDLELCKVNVLIDHLGSVLIDYQSFVLYLL